MNGDRRATSSSRVLLRPRFRRWFTVADATAFVEALRSHGDVRDSPGPPSQAVRDPDDDYLVALAEAADAVIVTGDDDLLGADLLSQPSAATKTGPEPSARRGQWAAEACELTRATRGADRLFADPGPLGFAVRGLASRSSTSASWQVSTLTQERGLPKSYEQSRGPRKSCGPIA
jgi:hypothetical protein